MPYLNYAELTAHLHDLVARYPELVRLESLGQTFEQREIWLLTLTRFATGEARDKPALWIDGNIHGTELSASSACLHLVEQLLEQPDLLDARAFYVAPRVCPDGAELACAPSPRFLRSSTRPYPFDEPAIKGWEIMDVDGDGTVRTIRIPAAHGPWKANAEEPRLLERRLPEDTEGPFYLCMREGRFIQDDWDGVTIEPSPLTGLDLNRNFPYGWRQESQQSGAGPYPASEPEVRALVAFLTSHPNVCFAVTYHTMSGCFLRPSCDQPDESLPREDLDLFKFFAKRGSEWSGYPDLSVFHDFRYDPKDVVAGTFHDWAYQHLGVFAWTTELWSPFRAAGLLEGFTPDTPRGKYRFVNWFRDHSQADERQMLRWSDEELDGTGYTDWRPFTHPQLGEVEIGGWDFQNALRNPPARYLRQELEPLTRWVSWLAKATPSLVVHRTICEQLGEGVYRIELVVENSGWLPSYVTKKALQAKLVRPLRVELKLPTGVTLVSGQLLTECGQLEGVAYKPGHPPYWWASDTTEHRCKIEWTVRGPEGARVGVTVRHDRCGSVRAEWILAT
jgi:hypothetical protein